MLTYDATVNIQQELSVNLPSDFKEGFMNSEYNLYFTYQTEDNGVFNECSISISVIDDYSNSEELIGDMSKYYKVTKEQEKINNIIWDTFVNEDSFGKTYYNSMTLNNKVHLLEYSIGSDVKENLATCEQHYQDIKSSIQAK